MTLSEFKAWFEGYTEGMDGPPSAKQWDRIQERVGQISGAPSYPYPVYIDRFPQYPQRPYWTAGAAVGGGAGMLYNGSGGGDLARAAGREDWAGDYAA